MIIILKIGVFLAQWLKKIKKNKKETQNTLIFSYLFFFIYINVNKILLKPEKLETCL